MKKILIFGTYPIKNPQHGGQKRLDAICNEYEKTGNTVRYIAIYHKPFYDSAGKYDIALPATYDPIINASPFTGDIVIGEAIYENLYIKDKIIKQFTEFNPDVIHIEQIFPYIGLRKLLKDIGYNKKIIFGSQNIEYSMKEQMLNSLGYESILVASMKKIIFDSEKKLSTVADLVAAVSVSDIEEHKKLGAKKCILAPNGIYKNSPTVDSVSHWSGLFRAMGVDRVVLFVGSAHPPNWIGFQEMVGRGLGFLPHNTRIVFAGSISGYVESELKKMKYDIGATTFHKRAYFAGRLSEEKLVGLLDFADIIILPITEGGGSNLKTAEAIVSDKKIVATSFAFRGFEKLKLLPNISIADRPDEFRRSILKSIATHADKRTPADTELSNTVLWQNCLSNLVKEVSSL